VCYALNELKESGICIVRDADCVPAKGIAGAFLGSSKQGKTLHPILLIAPSCISHHVPRLRPLRRQPQAVAGLLLLVLRKTQNHVRTRASQPLKVLWRVHQARRLCLMRIMTTLQKDGLRLTNGAPSLQSHTARAYVSRVKAVSIVLCQRTQT
jgi:hypothetical protein